MSALGTNTWKGRKQNWTEGEIGLLSSHNASVILKRTLEKFFFFNFFNIASREQMFYQDTSCTCHFLLNQSNLRNVINIADNIE